MKRKCKITEQDITFGPWEPDELEMFTLPKHLNDLGYRRVSNAYCKIARIDRPDWLKVMAGHMSCAVADFYDVNGSGVGNRWKDQYVRMYSKDTQTVSPVIFSKIESY